MCRAFHDADGRALKVLEPSRPARMRHHERLAVVEVDAREGQSDSALARERPRGRVRHQVDAAREQQRKARRRARRRVGDLRWIAKYGCRDGPAEIDVEPAIATRTAFAEKPGRSSPMPQRSAPFARTCASVTLAPCAVPVTTSSKLQAPANSPQVGVSHNDEERGSTAGGASCFDVIARQARRRCLQHFASPAAGSNSVNREAIRIAASLRCCLPATDCKACITAPVRTQDCPGSNEAAIFMRC